MADNTYLSSYENPMSDGFIGPDPTNKAGNTELAEKALHAVVDGMTSCRNIRSELDQKWAEIHRGYRNERVRRQYKGIGRADIRDPELFKAIEVLTARANEAILNQRPFFRGIPREPVADRRQVETVENLIQYQCDAGKGGSKLSNFNKNCAMYGTAIMRVNWTETGIKRPKRRKNKTKGEYELVEHWETLYRGASFRNVRINDFYVPDIFCEDVDDQPFVIERTSMPYAELMRLQADGKLVNVDKLKDIATGGTGDLDDILKIEEADAAGANYTPGSAAQNNRKMINILIYEGYFDLDGDGLEEHCWIWVAEGQFVLLLQENPYWHNKCSYVSAHYIKAPGFFYGISAIELAMSLWAELCDTHNQILDNKNFILSPPLVAGPGAGLTSNRIQYGPGKVIPIQGQVDQLKFLTYPDTTAAGYAAIGMLRNGLRETTGATDIMQGKSGGTDKATIYAGMLSETNMRLKDSLRNIYEMALEPMIEKMYALNEQYIDKETLVRVVGSKGWDFIPVRPEDLSTPMDFKGVGTGALGSMLSKNMHLQSFLQMIIPFMQAGVEVDAQALLTSVYNDVFGMTDGDRYFDAKSAFRPLDARYENVLLKQRQPVDVHPGDDDVGHIKDHIELVEDTDDDIVKTETIKHVMEHYEQHQAKEQEKQMQQAMQMAQMAQQLEGGGGQGQPPPQGQPQQGVPGMQIGNQAIQDNPLNNQDEAKYGAVVASIKGLGEQLSPKLGQAG